MIFSLLFGIGDALQGGQELLRSIDVHDLEVHVLREGVQHLLRLVQAQQAVVDEHAGELLADRLVAQRSRHRGIDAARKAEDDFLLADLVLDLSYGFIDVVRHVPIGAAPGDLVHEALQDLGPLPRVRHLGVELHRVEAARLVRHGRDRARVGGSHELEAWRELGDFVAMAHPHLQQAVAFGGAGVLDAVQQPGVAAGAHFGRAEFAHLAGLYAAAQLLRHGLHAVADTQDRHAELERRLGRLARFLVVSRQVAAGEDDALRAEAAYESVAYVVRMDLAVDLRFAHPPGDQLRVLGPEIQNQDFVVATRPCNSGPPS